MHDNHKTQKINKTSVMPEKTGVYWNSRFSIAPMQVSLHRKLWKQSQKLSVPQ
ncbi:TPA: tRNA-dihydrouridine synthase [Escherichia coli]|nr:tRNA-dihydrouridine synthase [Escherichia coli]